MSADEPSQFERAQALAERYKPLLVLYPEISSKTRARCPDWKRSGLPPLLEDYHPRDVRLVLDHARIPRRRSPHDGDRLLHELERNPKVERIDLLSGIGHADREKFWAEYYRIVNKKGIGHDNAKGFWSKFYRILNRIRNKEESHQGDTSYPYSTYVHVVYGDDLADRAPPSEHVSQYRGMIALEYWLIYLYNDWKATHEGDWELVVVFLRDDSGPEGQPEPFACAYSAHHGGYRLPWRQIEKVNDDKEPTDAGTHPVAYVANGSHANYFSGSRTYPTTTEKFGVRITTGEFPFTGEFMDYTTSFERGKKIFPEVKVVPTPVNGRWDGEWAWLNFRGEWGSLGVPKWLPRRVPKFLRFRLFRRIWGAPESLPVRRNWRNPFAWVDLECEEALLDPWLSRQGI